jgi:hypothetical protein
MSAKSPRGPRAHQAMSILIVAASVLALSAAPAAVAEVVLSGLSLMGEQRMIGPAAESDLGRVGIGEDGRLQVVDEFAVFDPRAARRVPFASEGFNVEKGQMMALQASSPERSTAVASRSTKLRNPRLAPRAGGVELLISHQVGHAPNSNFAPTPSADFVPQAVAGAVADGQKGFAIVDVGASGEILRVKLLSPDGPVDDKALTQAVRDGVKTSFQDERRHDHTVYMAYQVQGQMVARVGVPIVTMPECIHPPPGCE